MTLLQPPTHLSTMTTPPGTTLAFKLFYQPLPLDSYWLPLLLPLVLAISVVYKAIKLEDLRRLPRQAVLLSAQIITFMVLAAATLWLITELL